MTSYIQAIYLAREVKKMFFVGRIGEEFERVKSQEEKEMEVDIDRKLAASA